MTLLLLWGCIAPEAIISTNTDVDTAADTAGSTPPPEDTGEPIQTEPSWDISQWEGTLRFEGEIFGTTCSEQVTETGPRLAADESAYAACPTCSDVYRLNPSADTVCGSSGLGIALEQPSLRGILLGDGFAMVYQISGDSARLLDANGEYADGTLRFSYAESVGGSLVNVYGEVTFPEK